MKKKKPVFCKDCKLNTELMGFKNWRMKTYNRCVAQALKQKDYINGGYYYTKSDAVGRFNKNGRCKYYYSDKFRKRFIPFLPIIIVLLITAVAVLYCYKEYKHMHQADDQTVINTPPAQHGSNMQQLDIIMDQAGYSEYRIPDSHPAREWE